MEEILQMLLEKQDREYGVFQQKLIPTLSAEKIIGARTPALRSMAKQLAKDSRRRDLFLQELPHAYYDENQLHSFIIAENPDFDSCMEQVERFLPYVDNWSTCDQAFPKVFCKKQNRQRMLPYIYKWLDSGEVYTIRYGIGAAMRLFLDEDFDGELMKRIAGIRSGEYYVNMMIAWYLATALAKQWDAAVGILQEGKLDSRVHNKVIQKARESRRITEEQKRYLNSLKRKDQESPRQDAISKAMDTLQKYVLWLCGRAGRTEDYGRELWSRISRSEGVLRELAYYHDYGDFYGKYKVAGYSLTDILVWQVDHFKAYLDRPDEMNRYRTERLFLESLDVMLRMEKDPAPYVAKMAGETGTDFVGKYN